MSAWNMTISMRNKLLRSQRPKFQQVCFLSNFFGVSITFLSIIVNAQKWQRLRESLLDLQALMSYGILQQSTSKKVIFLNSKKTWQFILMPSSFFAFQNLNCFPLPSLKREKSGKERGKINQGGGTSAINFERKIQWDPRVLGNEEKKGQWFW